MEHSKPDFSFPKMLSASFWPESTRMVEAYQRSLSARSDEEKERDAFADLRKMLRSRLVDAQPNPAKPHPGYLLIDAIWAYSTHRPGAFDSTRYISIDDAPAEWGVFREMWDELVTKLRTGELVSAGFIHSRWNPEPISSENWEVIECRTLRELGESVVHLNGQRIWGVRICDEPLSGHEARYRTGVPGRPPNISKELILEELNRRGREKGLESTLAAEARFLLNWLRAEHPQFPPIKPGTMGNILRDDFNRWKNAQRKAPHGAKLAKARTRTARK